MEFVTGFFAGLTLGSGIFWALIGILCIFNVTVDDNTQRGTLSVILFGLMFWWFGWYAWSFKDWFNYSVVYLIIGVMYMISSLVYDLLRIKYKLGELAEKYEITSTDIRVVSGWGYMNRSEGEEQLRIKVRRWIEEAISAYRKRDLFAVVGENGLPKFNVSDAGNYNNLSFRLIFWPFDFTHKFLSEYLWKIIDIPMQWSKRLVQIIADQLAWK